MQYEKDITIDYTQVAATLTDFPVLIDIYDSDLRTDVQADGDDITFMKNDQALDFEIELFNQSFNSSHAHLVAWVKVPTLSDSVDTVLRMLYGNPGAKSSSSTKVWDEYETVHHLNQDPSGTQYDSTANNHDGTSYGTLGSEDAVDGRIDGAIDFTNETSDVISIGQVDTNAWTSFTASIWVKMDEADDVRVFSKSYSTTSTQHIMTTRIEFDHFSMRFWTDGYGGQEHDAGTTLTLGNWYYWVWSWDASRGTVEGYLNGNLDLNQVHGGTSVYDSNVVFTIGNTDLTNPRYFDGILDEVRLTTIVRSEAWIDTEYNNQMNPDTFLSVGSEIPIQSSWADSEIASLRYTTTTPNALNIAPIMTMDISGPGKSLDENMNEGTSFYVANDSIVEWTANVLVAPPPDNYTIGIQIEYPIAEWKPILVTNPLGQVKTYGIDWDFHDGYVNIPVARVDVWGVWEIKFNSWNYVYDLKLGPNSDSSYDSYTFTVGDTSEFKASTPWMEDARVGLVLTDPMGDVYNADSALTGTPGSVWDIPSSQYRMQLTVPASWVDSDLTNFPLLVSFTDSDFQDTSKVQADGDDFVFVDDGDVLAHEIERFIQSSGQLAAWVRVNLSSTVDNNFWLYYGNPVIGSTQSPETVWSNNYEAVWHLDETVTDEGSGETHFDSTANNYSALHHGNTNITGIGNSIGQNFDGDDWISINATEELEPAADVTISGWFYLNVAWDSTSTPSQTLVAKYLNGDNNFHITLVGTDYTESGVAKGSLAFGFERGNTEWTKWTQKLLWTPGWYHFACYLDANTPSNNKIFINGLDNTNAGSYGSAVPMDLSFYADWGIGGRYMETSEIAAGEAFHTGRIDEVRFSTTQRASDWILHEYENVNDQSSFVQIGSEVARTSPDHIFTKLLTSTALQGVWTASVYYNDTGSSVTYGTGLYEREFIVKHDSSLTLIDPADAVSDKTAYKVAGEILYIEVELTGVINSETIGGSDVKMNWSVSGAPTELSLNDIGNGRYGKSVNTSDLGVEGTYRIEITSEHQFYNDATDFFDIELYHATEFDYTNVDSTPVGLDFTATLVFTDAYDGTPIIGASIAFDNGTSITPVSQGGGMYNISLSTASLSYGDHWYVFKASKVGSYMVDGTVNVTFTLRKHYTSALVTGDLTSPEGQLTFVTVVIMDMDTGTALATTNDVISWSFTSGYSPINENLPPDFDVTLTTASWNLGPQSVTLSVTMSGIYNNPLSYDFSIQIREHYTSVSVIGDFLTPFGIDTSATLVIIDLDTGADLTSSNVSSYLYTWSGGSHSVNPALSLTTNIPTTAWPVGSRTVTLSVVMATGYANPTDYQFDIQIRNHYTSASVVGDLTTPFGSGTSVTVVITDTDIGATLSASEVTSYLFTWSGGSHSVNPAASLTTIIPTGSWPVGGRTVTLAVTMSGDYDNPLNYQFDIQIRNHFTSVNVAGGLITLAGVDTTVTLAVTDLDTAVSLTASDVTSYLFTWSGGSHSVNPATSLTTDIPTSSWPVGIRTVTLTVAMAGDYDNPLSFQFDIEIRNHYTSLTVIGDLTNPYESTTLVTIIVTDLDTGSELVLGDVESYTFSWSGGSYVENPATSLAPTLPTNLWNVGTVTVNLTLVMNGDFNNPSMHQFDIVIRNHYTAVTVVGSLTSPYRNATPLTVQVVDLDTGLPVNIADVFSFDFSWVGGSYDPAATSYDVTLPTDDWTVGTKSVTLDVTMEGASYYDDPNTYGFLITIRSLTTYLYNEPSNLIFPTGFDFTIIVRLNITEPGPHYGEVIDGQEANLSVASYPSTIVALGNGRYNISVDESFFVEGTFSITILYVPSNATLTSTQLIVVFDVRPTRSDLTSNLYTVSTPYNLNVTVVLYYEDLDRSTGIPSATVTSPDTWISFTPLGGGNYQVTIGVVGFALGTQLVNLTADAFGYDPRSVIITVVITQIHTDAEPSTISLDMPVGSSRIFYIDYNDLDNLVYISGATINHNWTGVIPLDITWTGTRYRVNMTTTGSDALGNLIVWFNFTKGAEYQPGYCEIEVVVRSHISIFNLVSAVEPTAYNGKINISVRYYDWDDKVGIDSPLVQQYVWNQTHWIASTLINDGSGFYTVQIDGLLFGLGLQTFTIYFNWTGPVEQFENKTLVATANLVGVDSKLTLFTSSEPTAYLGNMSYTILYSELSSGIGINNDTNNVFVYVIFQGETVNLDLVDIWEVDPAGSPGEISIQFNTTIFSHTGLIYMNLYINWSQGVAPFYTNRTDTLSVRLLPRDSLVSIIPASATPYNENATFSFTYEDVTGTGADPIGDSPSLSISLSLGEYTLYYTSATKTFTVSFNTIQFGAPLGQKSFTLDVVWSGAPFYSNRTGQIVFVTVAARQTILDYQAPAPTSFGDNVTFSVIWTDITSLPSSGIGSATITLYNGTSTIPSMYYAIIELPGGEYEIEFDSGYYLTPGNYDIRANITSGSFFYLSEEATRTFDLRYRVTLLSSEPIDKVPYNTSIVAILYYQDLLTLTDIGNGSSGVTLEIVPAGTWIYTCQWQPANSYYVLTIETYNQVGLSIGVEYSLTLNITYVDQDPFYRFDDLIINFELRNRASSLERIVSPVPTPYLEYTNFTVYYSDADALAGILGGEIHVYKGITALTFGTDFLYTVLGSGLYEIAVLTTALDGIGVTSIQVQGNWTAGSPYHNNATLELDLTVIRRITNVEIVVPPAQTRYLENATFVVTLLDLGSGQSVAVTKDLIQVYYGVTQLLPSEFSFTQQGVSLNYEISIDSQFLSAVLVTNLNVTVFVDWPDSPNYYQNDASSTRVTIVARDTFLSIERPANTAYGENATFNFQFLDVTSLPEVAISDSSELAIVTNLTEAPTIIGGVGIFAISFDTAQFGATGQIVFHLNVTWAGAPFYSNKTLQTAFVTVIIRQTQLDFEAPEPTPYGDNVTLTMDYLDIAGSSEFGIPDGILTLYFGGLPIPSENYKVTPDGSGNFAIEFYSGFFTEPGLYKINATIAYSGSEFKADATAERTLNVRLRSTLLSSEPVGKIGYATSIQVVLNFQDTLTIQDIANTSTTFLTILNDTGTPWDFTVQWRPATQDYLLVVQTSAQPLLLNVNYTLHINMSYVYASPYYRWDDAIIQFSLRTRQSSLDIQESPQPTPYLEYANFTLYYWDVDIGSGIAGASIELFAPGPLTLGVHYLVSEGAPGIYYVSVDSSVLGGLGIWLVDIDAIWIGGAPYHNNATRSLTVAVTNRPADVEIVSPPSAAKYWDNLTFTFSFTDQLTLNAISVTVSDITLYANGTILTPGDFSMIPVGTNFEVSINSTVLSADLVDRLNLTIVIDWNDATSPFYTDDSTQLRITTISRSLSVEPQPIDAVPLTHVIQDNMTIVLFLQDDDTRERVAGAEIVVSCLNASVTLLEGVTHEITEGTGLNIGVYTIHIRTEALGAIGNFLFEIQVNWNSSIAPFYANKSGITLMGSVKRIWATLQADTPDPSTVQISGNVSIVVTFTDMDHGQIGVPAGATITVTYLERYVGDPLGGTVPQGLLPPTYLGSGKWRLNFSTAGLPDTGSYALSITAALDPYTTATVIPAISVVNLRTKLTPYATTMTVNWTDTARILVNFTNLLHGNLTPNADVTWDYAGESGTFLPDVQPGWYFADINTSLAGDGSEVVIITAEKTGFDTSVTVVTLVVLPLPSDIEPINPSGDLIEVNRGSPIPIEIRLLDLYNNATLDWTYVQLNGLYARFHTFDTPYYFSYNSITERWNVSIPGTATGAQEPGVYSIRITARMDNYQPATYQFKVDLKLTETLLEVYSTNTTITAYFSENITVSLRFTAPYEPLNMTNARVSFNLSSFNIQEFFVEVGDGIYTLTFNTSRMSYGVWGLTFGAVPENPFFASNYTSIALIIDRIPTDVIVPNPFTVEWGWSGSLDFYLNDTQFNRGVFGAGTATFTYGPSEELAALDMGGGWYRVFINTTILVSGETYTVKVTLVKANHESAEGAVQITIDPRQTEVTVENPEQNQVDDDPLNLIVPMGDTIEVWFFYNDTSPIGDFQGGLALANISDITKFAGPSFGGQRVILLEDMGDGYYRFIFDTLEISLYFYSNGTPTVYGTPYFFTVGLDYPNRVGWEETISIRVIDVPTALVVTQATAFNLTNGFSTRFYVFLNDTWHGGAVENAQMTFISGTAVVVIGHDFASNGSYYVDLEARVASGDYIIEIHLGRLYHVNQSIQIVVTAQPNEGDILFQNITTYGLPAAFAIIALMGLYVRVWSVPKRLRQINSQIKAIRKGKIPKPIDGVSTRQEILAELFNDTYAELEITRLAGHMPAESIEVAVPEMGELLIQLSILTNLSAEELEEFQSDISKMRISEQAAFVREVIDQEAVRVARRDDKTPAEIIEDTRIEALAILRGEKEDVDERVIISEPEDEPVVLIEDKKPETPTVLEDEKAAPTDAEPVTEAVVRGEKLSDYEIEELRKELESRGVPPHEIDTIMEQARVLPRELVEELVRSLSSDEK
jgi:hypothetical protein